MLGMSFTSCSKFTPGIECPLCRNRLYRTFPKKSTPFSKIILEITRKNHHPPGCCQGGEINKFPLCGNSAENCTICQILLPLLCKLNSTVFTLFTTADACGSLVWITVCRMWKTWTFPQISRVFRISFHVENSVDKVDNFPVFHSPGVVTSPVCIQLFPEKKGLPVGICRLFGEVGWGSDPPSSDNLCEKPPKSPALPPFASHVSISRFGK